ncbi:putative tail protein [Rhizobium phage RHph_X66]|nr:putative tail protein [Rhizobium phage RHph_X66]
MSSTENVKLGVCNVLFDGVDLGFTKGGVEVEVATSTKEITVDQMGETPIGEVIMGRTVQATVPLAETTLDNLVAVMPGSVLISDGAKASGTITFSTAAPVNNDKISFGGVDYVFKTTPLLQNEMAIPATIAAAATELAIKINAISANFVASAAGGVVTVTAKSRGVDGNVAITKTVATPANVTVVNLTGGVDTTKAQVKVSTGVNINLLKLAKTLVLRPKGTNGEDDFTIHRAMCPGALNFAYQFDNERVFNSVFKGYAQDNGDLFAVGDVTATA